MAEVALSGPTTSGIAARRIRRQLAGTAKRSDVDEGCEESLLPGALWPACEGEAAEACLSSDAQPSTLSIKVDRNELLTVAGDHLSRTTITSGLAPLRTPAAADAIGNHRLRRCAARSKLIAIQVDGGAIDGLRAWSPEDIVALPWLGSTLASFAACERP